MLCAGPAERQRSLGPAEPLDIPQAQFEGVYRVLPSKPAKGVRPARRLYWLACGWMSGMRLLRAASGTIRAETRRR